MSAPHRSTAVRLALAAACLLTLAGVAKAQPPGSPPPAILNIEEAAKALDRLAPTGADRSLLVGLAGDADRQQVEAAARPIAASPDAQGPGQRLIQGRALLLLAALEERAEPRRELATRAVTLLAADPLTSTAAEGLRRSSLAAALWLSGNPVKQPGLNGDVDSPLDLLRSVEEFPVGTDAQRTIPRTLAVEIEALLLLMDEPKAREAHLKSLRSAAAAEGPRGTRPDPIIENLPDETWARLVFKLDHPADASGAKPPAPPGPTIGPALEPIALRATRLSESGDAPRAALLRDRVSRTIQVLRADSKDLPDVVKLADALARVARDPKDAGAIAGLESLSTGNQPEALWALAGLTQAAGPAPRAAVYYAQYAKRFPTDRRASEALRIAQQLAEATPDEKLARQLLDQLKGTPEEARAAERLATALTADPPEHRIAGIPAAIELLDRARALTPSDGPRLLLSLRKLGADLRAWADAHTDASAPAIVAAEAIEAWAIKNDPANAPSAAALLGDLLARFSDRGAQAVEAYKRALVASAGEPSRDAALDGLGRLASGARVTAVFEELKRYTDACDASASAPKPTPRPASYWHAWYRMLVIMNTENRAGSRTGQIRLRVRQLETIDPALGGGPWAEKIRELERALK